jgi:hypothetical protein
VYVVVGRFSQNFGPTSSRSRVFTKMRAEKSSSFVCVEAGRLLVFDLRRSLAH